MSGSSAVPSSRNPSLKIGVRELPGRSVMPNRPLPFRAQYQSVSGRCHAFAILRALLIGRDGPLAK